MPRGIYLWAYLYAEVCQKVSAEQLEEAFITVDAKSGRGEGRLPRESLLEVCAMVGLHCRGPEEEEALLAELFTAAAETDGEIVSSLNLVSMDAFVTWFRGRTKQRKQVRLKLFCKVCQRSRGFAKDIRFTGQACDSGVVDQARAQPAGYGAGGHGDQGRLPGGASGRGGAAGGGGDARGAGARRALRRRLGRRGECGAFFRSHPVEQALPNDRWLMVSGCGAGVGAAERGGSGHRG